MAFVEANRDTTATGLIGAGLGVLQRQWRLLLAMVVISILMQAGQKFVDANQIGGSTGVVIANIAVVVAGFVLNFALFRLVLSFEGLVGSDTPIRFFTFVGTSIVFGLAEGFGLLLLLVPGIMIMLRWLLAPTFVLARGMGVGESLNASRDATDGHRWSILGALVLTGIIIGIPFMVLIPAAGGMLAFSALAWNSPIALATLVAGAVAGVVFNAVHLGIYATLAGDQDRLGDVFG